MAALSPYTGLLVAIIVVLVLVDVVIAGRLVANRASLPPNTSNTAQAERQAAHPCNHGYYVSQAAHSKKGGGYVSGIARSNLGKDGKCTAPLPAQAPATTKGSDDQT